MTRNPSARVQWLTGEEFLRAVAAVRHGEAIFSPAIARRMIQYFGAPAPVAALPFPDLSEREREILDLIAQGLSSEAIAARFVLSLKTVRNHTSNILGKLQLRTRAEAAQVARQAGLGGERRTSNGVRARYAHAASGLWRVILA